MSSCVVHLCWPLLNKRHERERYVPEGKNKCVRSHTMEKKQQPGRPTN